ncbi:MAG: type I secretion system permease/ATPase [Pseudomonadota bacterium]
MTGATQEKGAGLAIIAWLAAHHARPFTELSVLSRLPDAVDLSKPEYLAQGLAAVGLRSRLVLRRPGRLDPAVLPAVLFARGGQPLILAGLSDDGRNARIHDPATGIEREEPLRALARRTSRDVLLATVEDDLAERRLAEPRAGRRGHWFWRPVRGHAGSLGLVVVAALGVNALGLALPLFVMNVYDRVIPNLAYVTLWTLALGVAIAIGLDLALRSVRAIILERVGRRLDTSISSTLFAQAMALPSVDRAQGSAMIVSHIRDFEQVREFFASATFVAVVDLAFIGIFLGVLWWIVGPLALVPLVAVPVVLLIALISRITVGPSLERTQALAGRRQSVLVEALSALPTVKSVGAEPVLQREWDAASAAAARVAGRARFWAQFATNATQVILQTVSVSIIVWGIYLIAQGAITIGALIAANILAGRALAPLATIAQTVFRAQYAMRALAALSEFMDQPVERSSDAQSSLRAEAGALSLEGVTVRYPGASSEALKEISLEVAPGETLALLGRVGSGKSTLGKVLSGLTASDAGTVLLDGRGISHYDPAELRAAVGYLPQEPELFTGTFRENLVIGRPRASEAEIARALRLAAMDEFVAKAPEGLNLFLGERGARLSGGQRQGLALARLLLRRPRLLFLDEPTSAMDRDMEASLARNLQELVREGTGLILCTHRPSLADIAPRVVVLEQGQKILDGPREAVYGKLRKAAGETPGIKAVT